MRAIFAAMNTNSEGSIQSVWVFLFRSPALPRCMSEPWARNSLLSFSLCLSFFLGGGCRLRLRLFICLRGIELLVPNRSTKCGNVRQSNGCSFQWGILDPPPRPKQRYGAGLSASSVWILILSCLQGCHTKSYKASR